MLSIYRYAHLLTKGCSLWATSIRFNRSVEVKLTSLDDGNKGSPLSYALPPGKQEAPAMTERATQGEDGGSLLVSAENDPAAVAALSFAGN